MKTKRYLLLLLALLAVALLALTACTEEPPIGGDPNSRDEVEVCTVTFDTACGAAVSPQTVERGEKLTKPADPTRPGYTFEGWYIAGEQWSFVGYVVTEDMTLVAEWRELVSTEGLEFTQNGEEYTVTGYTGTDVNLLIQPYYKGLPVTAIAAGAFSSRTDIASVSIPSSIKKIEAEAFNSAEAPKKVYITDLTAWCSTDFCEWVHFSDWSLYLNGRLVTDLVIPSDVETVSVFAFTECTALESVRLGCGLSLIGQSAFRNCTSLKSVTIPASVTKIGRGAFLGCDALESLTFAEPRDWYICKSFEYVGGDPIDLTDPVANAATFSKNEIMRYFYRKVGELV